MSIMSKICVSLAHVPFELCVQTLKRYPLVEIRMDALDFSRDQFREIFQLHPNLIATYRPGVVDESQRVELLKNALEWGANYADIEFDSSQEYREEITRYAGHRNKKIILSYHNYTTTPPLQELERVLNQMFQKGTHIAKIACMVNMPSHNAELLSLYSKYKDIISIGMGAKGKITRIAAPLLGAPFTYASLKNFPSAPGQFAVDEMIELMNLFEV